MTVVIFFFFCALCFCVFFKCFASQINLTAHKCLQTFFQNVFHCLFLNLCQSAISQVRKNIYDTKM